MKFHLLTLYFELTLFIAKNVTFLCLHYKLMPNIEFFRSIINKKTKLLANNVEPRKHARTQAPVNDPLLRVHLQRNVEPDVGGMSETMEPTGFSCYSHRRFREGREPLQQIGGEGPRYRGCHGNCVYTTSIFEYEAVFKCE